MLPILFAAASLTSLRAHGVGPLTAVSLAGLPSTGLATLELTFVQSPESAMQQLFRGIATFFALTELDVTLPTNLHHPEGSFVCQSLTTLRIFDNQLAGRLPLIVAPKLKLIALCTPDLKTALPV